MSAVGPRTDERPGPLLVVCRANLIRSPLAAALLRLQLVALGRSDLGVSSAGLQVVPHARAGDEAFEAALERGIDLSHHRPTQVTAEMLVGAALVITMTEEQRGAAARLSRVSVAHTFTLPELDRLLSATDQTPAATWGELARGAHAVRPLVAAVPEPEDVPDPVGRELYHHQVVADTMVTLTQRVVGHLAPRAAQRPG